VIEQVGAAERIRPRPQNRRFPVSRLGGTVFLALLLIGIAEGAVGYLRRSPVLERHVAGTNAITIHVVLGIAAAVTVISIQAWPWRRPSPRGRSPWAAPFSLDAMAGLGRTIRFDRGLSLANLARVVATAPLVLVLAYAPFRLGAQVIGGLDPNATVNAWGGPSYLGALLAHWLDGIVGFYAAAFLLSRVLVRTQGELR
jgi:hypothetical protein